MLPDGGSIPPTSTKPKNDGAKRGRFSSILIAGPWVMWKGTPYAHIMVPTTSMAKSASKAPAEKKAADKN